MKHLNLQVDDAGAKQLAGESGKSTEESRKLTEESKKLTEELQGSTEESQKLTEEFWEWTEKSRRLAESSQRRLFGLAAGSGGRIRSLAAMNTS